MERSEWLRKRRNWKTREEKTFACLQLTKISVKILYANNPVVCTEEQSGSKTTNILIIARCVPRSFLTWSNCTWRNKTQRPQIPNILWQQKSPLLLCHLRIFTLLFPYQLPMIINKLFYHPAGYLILWNHSMYLWYYGISSFMENG